MEKKQIEMEFDSLIYIIIAVVLAIVNAVAQKKKKEQAVGAAPKPANFDEQFQHSDEEYEEQYHDEERVAANPLEILFGQLENDRVKMVEVASDEVEVKEPSRVEPAPEPEPQFNDFHTKMQEKAQEFIDFKHEKNFFDFEEDSIASTAIGDVLTEEEEEAQAEIERKNDILMDFTAAKAIVFSEIIKPKYFATGVNS